MLSISQPYRYTPTSVARGLRFLIGLPVLSVLAWVVVVAVIVAIASAL